MGYKYTIERTSSGTYRQVRHCRRSKSKQEKPTLHTSHSDPTLYYTTTYDQSYYPAYYTSAQVSYGYPASPAYPAYDYAVSSDQSTDDEYYSSRKYKRRSSSSSSYKEGKTYLKQQVEQLTDDIAALRDQIKGHTRARAVEIRRYTHEIIPALECEIARLTSVNASLLSSSASSSSKLTRSLEKAKKDLKKAQTSVETWKATAEKWRQRYLDAEAKRVLYRAKAHHYELRSADLETELEVERERYGQVSGELHAWRAQWDPILMREGYIRA